jgi:ADP-ribose pyrophosphatase YjhB (NUDIX family)
VFCSPAEAAAREVEEETGCRPRRLEHLVTFQPMIGMVDRPHHVFLARGAERVGEPARWWLCCTFSRSAMLSGTAGPTTGSESAGVVVERFESFEAFFQYMIDSNVELALQE